MIIENKNFEYVRKLHWEEVFVYWYECEGKSENWINLAHDRGYDSWADWRLQSYAKPFGCKDIEWFLYLVKNPLDEIPHFFGGPFKTWVKLHYAGRNKCTFAELANRPAITNHKGVISISKQFPVEKIITTLLVNNEIIVIEGMHRCCALALMAKQRKKFNYTISIAIGKLDLKELPVVGKIDRKNTT